MNNEKQEIIVTDVQIPFISMVILMVKMAIASIPALFILTMLGGLFSVLFAALFH
ncbi:MAG: hypothetical protein PSN04_07505 [Methyloprofundus sp.]|nr:hypothetical protein [Methyloprofundus sp.]